MRFLIDENLPASAKSIFTDLHHEAQDVHSMPELRGQPDEAIFEYAVTNQSIIVTRDLNIANPLRFDLKKLPGIVVLRFPNDVSIDTVLKESKKLLSLIKENHWHNIIILEPGSARLRKIS